MISRFLSGIGAITLCISFLYLLVVFSSRSSFEIEEQLASPNKKYIATYYVAMKSGVTGWCKQRVAVSPEKIPFSVETEQSIHHHYLFTATCGAEIRLEWESNKLLVVYYSTLEHMFLSMSKTDILGEVEVVYKNIT
ncbi:hypothetical protein [Motilimonas pumila]|uniref:hypothetical protein n=1 Tax=Motilimonas pumila TaxID=2303987 RepID=UPI000E757D3E|nr:hypothetical protein [Motilimonas pumila]